MKRHFIYTIFISAVLVSCKKDNNTVPQTDSKKYEVAFNVTGFSKSQAPFGTYAGTTNKIASNTITSQAVTTDTLAQNIGVLYYSITDSKGALVSKFTQFAPDSTFGKIKASLAPGNYHVSVAGGRYQNTASDPISLTISRDTANQFLYQNIYGGRSTSFGDTFLKSMDITVGNTAGSYNFTLDRIVAQVAVNIQDAIPADARFINITINNDHYILKADGTSEGSTGQIVGTLEVDNTISFKTPAAGTTNTKTFRTVLNTQSAMSVKITCYDGNNNIIASRTIDNVTCKPNHITLLTGNLFTGASGSGVGVSYNTAWNIQTINYAF